MTPLSERFATEAERLAGSPFRLHGRDPRTGLDCVGLAMIALRRAGGSVDAPSDYALRNRKLHGHLSSASRTGFDRVEGETLRGDLLMLRPGPSQHHLVIALGEKRFVHAHAGLRRVVLQTGLASWPLLQHWRLSPRSE